MSRPRHRMPSPRPLPQCAQPPLRMRLPFRTHPPFRAPSPLRARHRRPRAAARTCSRTPPRSAAPPQDEISLRNNLEDAEVAEKKPRLRVRQGKPGCNGRDAMRFHCVIILPETVSCLKAVARRGGFGNRGPPRGVMRSDAMNCGPPRVCLGSRRRGEKNGSLIPMKNRGKGVRFPFAGRNPARRTQ